MGASGIRKAIILKDDTAPLGEVRYQRGSQDSGEGIQEEGLHFQFEGKEEEKNSWQRD